MAVTFVRNTAGQFEKGFIPWNKGKKGLQVAWNKGLTKETSISLMEGGIKGSATKTGKPHGHKTNNGNLAWNKGIIWNEMRGEKHPNWKGGVTTQDRLDRVKFKQTVQKLVFQRDNYTCQICGSKGELQVDHIQPWAKYVEGRFDMDNCRTLCASCHYELTFGRPMPENVKGWGHNLLERGRLLFQ